MHAMSLEQKLLIGEIYLENKLKKQDRSTVEKIERFSTRKIAT